MIGNVAEDKACDAIYQSTDSHILAMLGSNMVEEVISGNPANSSVSEIGDVARKTDIEELSHTTIFKNSDDIALGEKALSNVEVNKLDDVAEVVESGMLIGTIKNTLKRKAVESMEQYQKVRSVQQPETKVIDDFSVWVAENITPVSEAGTDEQPGFEGYEYDLTQYTKDEYIQLIDEKNASLEAEITSTQLALCDVYEMLG